MKARAFQSLALLTALIVATPARSSAQDRGAIGLAEATLGLGTTVRVLMIGAHPDDEDTQLIAWLSRGRHVETAYLSLTRGDGGQNLIGNELGPALGIIRTEELLAARRVDGGRQFFTRALDFGFSKNAEETLRHWPHDSLLRDVVTVVRAFRPQVIVAVFSGTPRDGHGHHQVSGILAREAFDLAADTVRFPSRRTAGLGPWSPAKFYRDYGTTAETATFTFNSGEYDALLGRSFAEIAAESRSQHLSQGFGVLQNRGPRFGRLRLDATHVTGQELGAREASLFAGLDTGWTRFAGVQLPRSARAALDALPQAIARARASLDLLAPDTMVAPLANVVRLATAARAGVPCATGVVPLCGGTEADLALSLDATRARATAALLSAAGVAVEAFAARPEVAIGDTLSVSLEVYDQGRHPLDLLGARAWVPGGTVAVDSSAPVAIAPDSAWRMRVVVSPRARTEPWWLRFYKGGDVFPITAAGDSGARPLVTGEDRDVPSGAEVRLRIAGADVVAPVTIVHRFADPARGELRRPLVTSDAVTLTFAREVEYLPANEDVHRTVEVRLRSASTAAETLAVHLSLPAGLRATGASQQLVLQPFASTMLRFDVTGRVTPGTYPVRISARADSAHTFAMGYTPIEYAHIRPRRLWRDAELRLAAVDVKHPANLHVAYIRGVGDNVAPMLTQLGIPLEVIDPADLARADLSRFTTIAVGPRAFEASPELAAAAGVLQDFARRGGTVVVQYGQNEMTRPGILPYAITLSRPAERVTEEDALVRVLDPASPLLTGPNRVDDRDFANWVQERASYMPSTHDERWHTVFSMNDTGERPNDAAVLVAPLGQGVYVYTTMSFFRQLPAGNPGAARLFLNLLAADQKAAQGTATPAPAPRP